MFRQVTKSLLVLYFFNFFIDNINLAYDRYTVQFLYLSGLNIISFCYLIYNFPLVKIFNLLRKKKLLIFYSLFILISAISILSANNQVSSIILLSQYLIFFFALILCYSLASFAKVNFIKLLFTLCVISVFFESAHILYIFFENVILGGIEFSRSNNYSGFAGNVNISAFSIAVKLPVVIYYIFKTNKTFNRTLLLIILSMTFFTLFILLSRGAFLAIIFATLTLILFAYLKTMDKRFIKTIFVAISIFISYTSFNLLTNGGENNIVVERLSSLNLSGEDRSINLRLSYYQAALTSIKKYPLLGIGLGNWKIESIKYAAPNMRSYIVPMHAHNDFLQVASESGVFALIFFSLLFLYPYFFFIKKKIYAGKENEFFVILVMMSVYLIDSMLNFPISRPISHIFLIFLLVSLTFLIERNEISNQ